MGQVAVSAPERRALAPTLAPHAPPGRMPGVYAMNGSEGRQPLADVRGGRAALARVLRGVAQWERAGRARRAAPRRSAGAPDEAVDARRQQCYADVRAPPATPAPRTPSARWAGGCARCGALAPWPWPPRLAEPEPVRAQVVWAMAVLCADVEDARALVRALPRQALWLARIAHNLMAL
jgi:hypothetical protein